MCHVSRALFLMAVCIAVSGCEFHYSVDGGPGKPGQSPGELQTSDTAYIARVMTYNIQFLSPDSANHGNRIEKLRNVISDINPTIVGVQEAENRAAMELVFPPSDWHIIIDDDSRDRQDVAFAIRKPWEIINAPVDLDANDEHFLAEGPEHEPYFPIRRDGLFLHIESPGGTRELTVVNIHAKARVGGRANTDHRRAGASRVLLEKFQDDLKGRNIVLLGDFNDTPDDASLNILETGKPDAAAEKSTQTGSFMVNLAEPLWAQNMVTHGANANRLDRSTGLVNNTYPEARERNLRSQKRNVGTGPIMFDQILVLKHMENAIVPGSATIYRKPLALEGPGFSRPSDHLPMYVDIKMQELK